MKVAVTGGTGMLGRALVAALRARGDEVIVLTRHPAAGTDELQVDAARGVIAVRRLEGFDAVVNLAGAPLATRPWTTARRQILLDSRVGHAETLLRSFARLDAPPKAFIGIATLGLFGDRGEEPIDDDDPPGTGFLAELGVAWEGAQLAAADVFGARAAVLRVSIALDPHEGAFPAMVAPFRFGFGGWLGNGRQYTSWTSSRDVVRALTFLLDAPDLAGAFNGGVPEPVPNAAFFEALGRALGKPVKTHAPRWALKGALGELGDAIFLASCRAVPRKLTEAGFTFEDGDPDAMFQRLVAEMAP